MSKLSIIQLGLLPTHASVDQRLANKGLSAAIAVSLVLVICALFLRPLIPVDETRYLTVAWEMFSTRDWLVPHLNGEPYSHKPPMLFWLINLAWFITGSNSEFIARLAPALFFPLNIFLTFVLGSRMGQPRQAAMAALILAGIAPFCIYASLVMFDSMLATAALLAIIGLVDATGNKPWRGFLLFGAALGFGLLVKGPAIFLHVLPAALLAPLWAQQPKSWRMWYLSLLESIALGTVVGLAWAMPAAVSGGQEYGDMILWGQTTGRMVNSFDHARPFWFYAAILPLLLFPWVLSRNFWAALRRSKMARGDDRIQRLPLIVAVGGFVLFSFVSESKSTISFPRYLLPRWLWLARWKPRRKVPLSEPGFAVLLFFLGLVAIFFGLFPTAIPKIHFGIIPGSVSFSLEWRSSPGRYAGNSSLWCCSRLPAFFLPGISPAILEHSISSI